MPRFDALIHSYYSLHANSRFISHRPYFASFRLSKAYGGRAKDVLEIDKNEVKKTSTKGKLLPGMPYLDAEVSAEK